ncbi:MAG: type I secretion system permease/ATPase [Lentilitoribacter sp.]
MRFIFIVICLFSIFINILGLVGPFFMLQVYDRVIPSGSVETLVALAIIVFCLYYLYGFLDVVRGRLFVRLGSIVEQSLSKQVFAAIAGLPLREKMDGDVLRPSRELDQIKTFLSGAALGTLFDLPWLPVYMAICFFIDPLIGLLALGAIILLFVLNLIAVVKTNKLTRTAMEATARRNSVGEAVSRNAEMLTAMGMGDQAGKLWSNAGNQAGLITERLSDITGFYGGASKVVRHTVQSAALGIGAYLVIQGHLTGGAIIAGSIIVARTVAPVDQLIAQWRGMLSAHQSWKRLKQLIAKFPEVTTRTKLPTPEHEFSVEGIHVTIPGQTLPTISNVSFRTDAGTVIGVIGPSGSGKSTLVRALTGVLPLRRGKVSLDGASLDQWSASDRGNYIGYMPQVSEFLPGTIAANISRFTENSDDNAVVKAAKAAGAHDMIVALANGYDTLLGQQGAGLSAGQSQRISLARAFYGDPFLIVLDEPNSNLDRDGEQALATAIDGVRNRGGIVIVVAHRENILSVTDKLLVIEKGFAKGFGPRKSILTALEKQKTRAKVRTHPGPALAVIENEDQSDD